MRPAALATLTAVTAFAALVGTAAPAHADVTHVVQRGHTIEAIAHRYHVSVKSILEANHLTDAKHLRPGQTLVIPGVDAPKKKAEKLEKGEKGDKPEKGEKERLEKGRLERGERPEHADKADKAERREKGEPPRRAATAALEPPPAPRGHGDGDSIHAVRLGEEFRIRVKDGHGHIPPSALKAFERMMRQGNATHPVDPRLVALVSIVSAHFGGKPLEIVSGFRAYTPTQYTPHSNHNLGKALDFHIRGVTNEALRDFCRTLRSAGCGYYPNSTFVHLDVRDTKAFWIDYSHPGEPPKYDKPGVDADEGTSDVPNENPPPPGSSEPAPDVAPESPEKSP
ncbi:MAG TPA: DUF882 domain-containing protein [Polyangiaceae bacterium]